MAGLKGSESVRSLMYPSKNALLPPKIPCGLRHGGQKISDEKTHHQRTSSESHELPIWLDDLLNEQEESPARKCGHRRSSSDSYAYLDVANATNISLTLQNDFSYRNTSSSTQRGIQELVRSKNDQRNRSCWLPSTREGASYMSQEATTDTLSHDPKNNSNPQPVTYEAENIKRSKQQFAQRSRVRKLQYISELERNIQTLQVEGSKVSAELDFLNQRNLILSMENKALKHRLETIAQEKLIKQLEQEVLENEIGRLRALYQQQKQQQTHKPSVPLGRATSKNLESQFSSLSLKNKDSNSRHVPYRSVMGQFHF